MPKLMCLCQKNILLLSSLSRLRQRKLITKSLCFQSCAKDKILSLVDILQNAKPTYNVALFAQLSTVGGKKSGRNTLGTKIYLGELFVIIVRYDV